MGVKGRLYDCNGKRIELLVKAYDLETGLVEFFITDLKGIILSNSIGVPLQESTYFEAPLKFKQNNVLCGDSYYFKCDDCSEKPSLCKRCLVLKPNCPQNVTNKNSQNVTKNWIQVSADKEGGPWFENLCLEIDASDPEPEIVHCVR